MSVILVVAPHPDDETLGCGGTLLRHKSDGDILCWVIMTRIAIESGHTQTQIDDRINVISQVSESYGFDTVFQAEFLTTTLDVLPMKSLVEYISTVFNTIKPDTVYIPFNGDVHTDHRYVFDAVSACVKPFRYPSVKSVLAYQTLSETEYNLQPGNCAFKPNVWVDISKHIEQKIKIMHMYSGEMGEHPFPRSEKNLRAQAIIGGARAGKDFAEGFMLLQEIR
jgi:LmbE family N-acetylglucosaminyl deacetylase